MKIKTIIGNNEFIYDLSKYVAMSKSSDGTITVYFEHPNNTLVAGRLDSSYKFIELFYNEQKGKTNEFYDEYFTKFD